MAFSPANHYEIDGVVSGTVDTSSFSGKPAVSLQVGGVEAQDAQLRQSPTGLQVEAALDAQPDLNSRDVLVLLPQVNVDDYPVTFAAVALVITSRTSIGGPGLVDGPVNSYEIHPLAGRASVVDF